MMLSWFILGFISGLGVSITGLILAEKTRFMLALSALFQRN